MTDDPSSAVLTRRPGGLTALAVLNIVFAVIGMLSGLGLGTIANDSSEMSRQADEMERIGDEMAKHPQPGQSAEMNKMMTHGMANQMRQSSPGGFRLMSAFGYTGGVLLLVSAFGMLGRRRLIGRHVAIGASLSLIGCAVVAVTTQGILFWSFPMLGAVYAIVLLAMTNTAYKRVLVA